MKRSYLFLIVFFCFSLGIMAQSSSQYAALIREANSLYESRQYKKAAQTYSRAFRVNGWKAYRSDRYNAACAWTLAGNKDSAFYQLFKVADAFKYDNYDRIANDSVLASLTKDERWPRLLNIVKLNIGKEESQLNKSLLKLMDSVYHDDQAYRFQKISVDKEFGPLSEEGKHIRNVIKQKDSLNEIIVSKLLDSYGWLGKEVIGSNGNATISLVLEHSSLNTQLKYLPMMREAVQNKKADASDLAILEDEVLIRQGKKQLYGTCLVGIGQPRKYYVAAMEDPAAVDKRRIEIGLGPLEEYLKNWDVKWTSDTYEKGLKILENEHITR
jgi:hypothetical protein